MKRLLLSLFVISSLLFGMEQESIISKVGAEAIPVAVAPHAECKLKVGYSIARG